LAEKYGITFQQITFFLGAIGNFIKEKTKEDNIVHIQKFGKFVPIRRKNGKRYKKTRADFKDREEENSNPL
jgi:nucleoid DNA-binding protein